MLISWICLWMRKGCTSLRVRRIAAIKSKFRKHFTIAIGGILQYKSGLTFLFWLHLDKLVQCTDQPWLDCFWVNLHFSTYCRCQIKILKALFNSNRGHIAIQKWSQIFILTSFGQISTMRRVERAPGTGHEWQKKGAEWQKKWVWVTNILLFAWIPRP